MGAYIHKVPPKPGQFAHRKTAASPDPDGNRAQRRAWARLAKTKTSLSPDQCPPPEEETPSHGCS